MEDKKFQELNALIDGRANINQKIKSSNFHILGMSALGSTILGFGALALQGNVDTLHVLNLVFPLCGLAYSLNIEVNKIIGFIDIKNKNYSFEHLKTLFKETNTDETSLNKAWLSLQSNVGQKLNDLFTNDLCTSEKLLNNVEKTLNNFRKSLDIDNHKNKIK